MYELIHLQHDTYGRDAFGEFGTLLATDADLSIPDLSDFQSQTVVHNISTETTDSQNHTNIKPEVAQCGSSVVIKGLLFRHNRFRHAGLQFLL